jgi:hypothetical protein
MMLGATGFFVPVIIAGMNDGDEAPRSPTGVP